MKKYTKSIGIPYLLKYSNELNILADCIGNRLGICYKTSLINFHHKTQGFDAVRNSTVNLDFKRLKPQRTKIQKIKQGTNNEGKWKETIMCQAKQPLIMLGRLPDETR